MRLEGCMVGCLVQGDIGGAFIIKGGSVFKLGRKARCQGELQCLSNEDEAVSVSQVIAQ